MECKDLFRSSELLMRAKEWNKELNRKQLLVQAAVPLECMPQLLRTKRYDASETF